jgi:hypothetical protein
MNMSAHKRCFGDAPFGIVSQGSHLSQSNEQMSGVVPKLARNLLSSVLDCVSPLLCRPIISFPETKETCGWKPILKLLSISFADENDSFSQVHISCVSLFTIVMSGSTGTIEDQPYYQ